VRAVKALLLSATMIASVVAWPGTAVAEPVEDAVDTFTYSQNMHPMGYSARNVPLANATPGAGLFNSDLVFWGKTAYQGTYEGFRIIDITQPDNPVELNDYAECSPGTSAGNQGDVLIWEDLLIRSWNSPATATASCDGDLVGAGFEGLHIFDVSDPADPDLVGSVPLIGGATPNLVIVDPPSSAAGTYVASGAAFGPTPTEAGFSGAIELVNDGVSAPPTGTPTDGCESFTLTAGAIALIDRGLCGFTQKVANAQAAGAGAVIVVNNVAGAPITMGGTDATITIPAVMVSLTDGTTIKAGLPATGTVARSTTFGCGSHTATLVPDLANDRLLVYNSASSGDCPGIDIVEVPLDDPGDATFLRREPSGRSCHDTGVILGDAMLAACAGGNGFTVWSLAGGGATLEDPEQLYSKSITGVTIGHSASFTWDGQVLIFGHEPGGGGQAQCQATSSEVNRTLFFFEAETGDSLGTFLHPRPQTATENCTWHNYNVVPTRKKYVLVAGNYQSGISVVDFSDPSAASEVAFADPAPLVNPDNPAAIELGGDWSTYWYNGRIYESDITRGLIIWELSGSATAGAMKLGHLNPQTQEFSL